MVLLKNDGTLPLKPEVKNIAVVGPLADQTAVLLGNYNGTPTHTVSFMEGLKKEFPNAKITYVPGTQFLHPEGTPVPANLLTTPDGKPGLKAEYGAGLRDFGGARPKPITTRVEPTVDLTADNLPAEAKGKSPLAVQWSGFLTPAETGDYLVGIKSRRRSAASRSTTSRLPRIMGGIGMGRSSPRKGPEGRTFSVVYGAVSGRREPMAQLIWAKVDNGALPAALEAARKADVVIAVVGITSELEGEEMPVNEPGFLGGDRTSLDMPEPEEALVQEVAQGRQAARRRSHERQRPRRQLGEGARQCHPRSLVLGRRGRHGHRRDPERQERSRRPPARHLLQGRQPASQLRRLLDGGPHLPLLPRRSRSIRSDTA